MGLLCGGLRGFTPLRPLTPHHSPSYRPPTLCAPLCSELGGQAGKMQHHETEGTWVPDDVEQSPSPTWAVT